MALTNKNLRRHGDRTRRADSSVHENQHTTIGHAQTLGGRVRRFAIPPCASLCALVIRATRTPNGSDVRSIRRRSEAQGVNVLRSKTKVRKLFIIKRSEPRPYALLPGIVVSLNKSTHQARSGFQVLGRACGHASPQKLKVHDRLLFFLQRETEGPHSGRRAETSVDLWRPRGGARRPMSCKARVHV